MNLMKMFFEIEHKVSKLQLKKEIDRANIEKGRYKPRTTVITVSKVFPSCHPKKGQPTNFQPDLNKPNFNKIHTIRKNWPYWEEKAFVFNTIDDVFSIRQWSGKPYNSQQVELFRLGYIRAEPVEINFKRNMAYFNGCRSEELDVIAQNDGLSPRDFYEWFKGKSGEYAMIYFDETFKY